VKFPPNPHFPSDAKLAYESLVTHADLTGNATSQALLAFFHSTGFRDVVPVNQALAQLYYTFASNGGDRGAQKALGYRYWSGIGTLEDCERALDWYETASEQGKVGSPDPRYSIILMRENEAMAKFLSGPPGGRTLPQTATRLSDLVGGVYGPGASVASSGFNANRAAIKAGISQSSGETWADILDYYVVCQLLTLCLCNSHLF
jgi:SEL1 protein